VIWRLPTHAGIEVYLLFEFQSEVDWSMAVRTQIYQGLLWQQVIDARELKRGGQLPPLLLLVLYNGRKRWEAPTRVKELMALSSDSALWPWQPEVQYYLLDFGAFPRDELSRRRSLAAFLFRLERPLTPKALESLLGEVSCWFLRQPNQGRLQRLFGELVRRACAGLGMRVPLSNDFLEMKMRSNLETIGETWKQEALAEGLSRGLMEGRAEGKAEALVCLLVEKFGALAPSLRTRIRRAKLATLDRWFKRAIVAPNLSSVFASRR